ncbi:hypothetical protein [Candidatus Lokiarchaeum ossiferum]|uniref:hypothetical protein n=1 Tax=Candidatus Lokiarchaeum ossiferum TaxID=2951803 RepID=UPI00352CFF92
MRHIQHIPSKKPLSMEPLFEKKKASNPVLPSNCRHHDFIQNSPLEDYVCQRCGLMDPNPDLPSESKNVFKQEQTFQLGSTGKNPFSLSAHKKLYTAFQNQNKLILQHEKILQQFELIASNERLSPPLKKIILKDYEKFLKYHRKGWAIKNYWFKLAVYLLCMKFEFNQRHIPFPYHKYCQLVIEYSLTEAEAKRNLSSYLIYLAEFRKFFHWKHDPNDWGDYITYIITHGANEMDLRHQEMVITRIAQQIGRYYIQEIQNITTSSLLFACSLVNIASFLTLPVIPCKVLSSMCNLEYGHLNRTVKDYYHRLFIYIQRNPSKEPWAEILIRRAPYFFRKDYKLRFSKKL